MRQSRLRTTV